MKKRISIITPHISLTHLVSLLKSSEPKPKPRARLTHMRHPNIVQLFQIYIKKNNRARNWKRVVSKLLTKTVLSLSIL